ncbi:MAG TPA: hypothetical protein VMT89_03805 [Candidatus Acidoferrales bacterium]|nr:hypothetical protein [Candidatus Acidoferrales bacterium]
MHWTVWVSMAIGIVAVIGTKISPPPVILDLGPVVPTPVPTAKHADKKRLITTITVQNNEEGESVVSFEAADFADEGEGNVKMIASKRYSLADEKKEVAELRDKILHQVRDLERDMLTFAEKAGPPKARAPLSTGSMPQ